MTHTNGFRPLAGCGLFHELDEQRGADRGFRPLAGCGLFPLPGRKHQKGAAKFPSPCGVWVVSKKGANSGVNTGSFRPLAGRGLFPSGRCLRHGLSGVSVPLRGVGCFIRVQAAPRAIRGFRPLAGCGLFLLFSEAETPLGGFRPLAGCGLFPMHYCPNCGAKMVSVPLRGVGCFGKAAHSFWRNRKKNCQLCYFIVSYWQMFINSKLRNCKVPCEAHKTAT